MNDCTSSYFAIDTLIGSDDDSTCAYSNANDCGLAMLMNGEADVVYLYSDQAYQYVTACAADETTSGSQICSSWNQFGAADGYAYIHTGMSEFAYAGTTLAMSKKGSGLKDVLDPCITAYLATESYYDVCVKWGLESSCFANDYFPSRRLLAKDSTGTRHVGRKLGSADADYDLSTPDQADGCSNGYCSCADVPARR